MNKEEAVQLEAKQLAERFKAVANRAAFGREFGIEQALIYQHLKGLRPISLDAAQRYARGFGCSLEDISPRLAEAAKAALGVLPSSHSTNEHPAAYSVHREPEAKVQSNVVKLTPKQGPSDYVQLEIFDIPMSAGPGAAEIEHPDVVSHLPVLREWALDNLGSADPKIIKLVTAVGDSMHPTIEDGSLLFVDVRVRTFQGDGIYCLAWNGGMLVKRLVALRGGALQITSDNPAGPRPEVVSGVELNQLAICGRVKRWWSLRKA